MKKILFTSMIAIFLLGACNIMNGEDDARQGDNRTGVEQTRYNHLNSDNRGVDNRDRMTNENQGDNRDANDRHRNGEYRGSQEAADAITSEIPEVTGAYVIMMGSNAYVAAMFDEDRQNQTGNTNRRNTDDQNRGNDNRNRTGGDNGIFDDEMDESEQLTDDIKERIAAIVREENDTITNVYVTTNPEFSNLTRDYMNDIDNGEPIEGFFDQIGSMIERIFPQNKR